MGTGHILCQITNVDCSLLTSPGLDLYLNYNIYMEWRDRLDSDIRRNRAINVTIWRSHRRTFEATWAAWILEMRFRVRTTVHNNKKTRCTT